MPISTVGRSNSFVPSGFTLIELVVVIAVISIAAVMLVPNLDWGEARGIEKTVEQFRTRLDEARTHARLTREEVLLEFDARSMRIKGEEFPLPSEVLFVGMVSIAEGEGQPPVIAVDRRGIVPASILWLEVEGEEYSILVRPIIRQLEWRKGSVGFDEFDK